jgi:hypothetical protein
MTGQGDSRTDIASVHGATHTGSGPQHNYFLLSLIDSVQRRRAMTGLWSAAHLDWLEQRFVEPGGFGKASAALDERKALVLKGAPGSGRRTAAMMLLRKGTANRLPGTRFRELFPAKVEGDPDWDAEELVERDDRLLLDLTTVEEDGLRTVEKGLLEFRGVIEAREAFLVIIAGEDAKPMSGAADLDCHIASPDRVRTLARYLELEGIREPLSSLLPKGGQLARLDGSPMSEISRLVELVRVARDSEPLLSPSGWLGRAYTALTEDGSTVAERISKLELAPQRALYLSTALVSGATADVAADAAGELLKIIGDPADTAAVLDSPNLAERLREIGAGIDARRKVRFDELAHDAAVLTYYWDAFPRLRSFLVGWVDQVVRYEQLTREDRHAIVVRYAEQSLRTDRVADVVWLIERWTHGGSAAPQLKLVEQAMTLLNVGLADKTHGQQFRQRIYAWSKKDSAIHVDLAAVLIEACLGPLAESHPEQALVRLHHFARRKGEVGELGRVALARFVEEDDRRLRRLLYRLAFAGKPDSANARVFLRVVAAERLTADRYRSQALLEDRRVREELSIGWQSALSLVPADSRPALGRWLDVAAVVQDDRSHLLLDVLATAANDFSTASRLEVTAYAWAQATDEESPTCTPAQRTAVVSRLIGELDRRQKSGTLQAPPARHREQDPPPGPPAWEEFE